jgi:hypothetical protein
MPAVKDRPAIDEQKLREQLAKTRELAATAARGTVDMARRGYAAAAVGAGAVGDAAIGAAKQILPSRFTLAFAVALLHYASKWFFGFSITPFSFITSAIAALAFKSAGFEWKSLFMPFLFETLIPGFLIMLPFIPSGFTSIFVILPWWVIFALINGYFKYHVSSWLSNITVGILFVWGIIILARSSYVAVTAPTFVLDQEFIYSVKKNLIDQPLELFSRQIKITWCQITTQSSRKACEDKLLSPAEAVTLIQVQESLETTFTMDVPRAGFPAEGDDFVSQIPVTVTAANNLDAQTMSFSCGLDYGRKQVIGKPVPGVIGLSKGDSADSVVQCTFEEDLQKRRGTDFYFNATTTTKAKATRDFLVVNGEFRDTIFNKYINVPRNKVILLSTEFGPIVRENLRAGLLNPRVGRRDLVQPIIHVGEVTFSSSIQPPYVLSPQKVYFALYLKNNGPGLIKGIRSINIDLPDDFNYAETPENCGLKLNELKDISLGREESLLVAGCYLVPTGEYGNIPLPRTINVDVEYDYAITRKRKVDIV